MCYQLRHAAKSAGAVLAWVLESNRYAPASSRTSGPKQPFPGRLRVLKRVSALAGVLFRRKVREIEALISWEPSVAGAARQFSPPSQKEDSQVEDERPSLDIQKIVIDAGLGVLRVFRATAETRNLR